MARASLAPAVVRRQLPPYRQGFDEGYRQGTEAGIRLFEQRFEGTSIIIPTYNQAHFLRRCIESIERYTGSPYEIIVVDNASKDGTRAYLESLGGKVRYRVNPVNQGFAGAINVGLMMAKGQTILLLNNDILVTPMWLENMLHCLFSDPAIGIVGPVTNFISGDQRIRVPYRNLREMQVFARKHNQRNPALWQRTDQLRGFCLLFKRELFEQVGYFDEGFELGNFEDDDYNVRVRLLGKKLVMAKDTFIHHFGSVSIKALGPQIHAINHRNQSYFNAKWNEPFQWVYQVRQHPLGMQGPLPSGALLYPEAVAVQGTGPAVYWIEGGVRRPVEGALPFPATRISQVDLRRWPVGAPIGAAEAERKWRGVDERGAWGWGLVTLPDGTFHHMEGQVVRRVISTAALEAWHLHLKPVRAVVPEDLAGRGTGLPIIAPPRLRQPL